MTATNLLKAVVEEKKVKLTTLEAELDDFACTGLNKRNQQNELKKRKLCLKAELENIAKEICQADIGIQCNAMEAQKRQIAITLLKEELECASREIEIDTVIKRRKDFYAALLIRLVKLQEELKDTDVDCKEPKEVIEELRLQIESIDVSDYHQLIRCSKGKYDRLIRKQAEKKVDGVKVSAKDQFSINEYLDEFLKLDEIIERWG